MAASGIKFNAKVKANQDGSSKGKAIQSINKKKIEISSKQMVDSKNKSSFTARKPEVKGKSTSNSSKSVTKTTTTVKAKVKKVYTLAGQRYDPPEEREPLRIFYESLSKQIPSSEMAEFWMMEHGLLSPERSKKAYERKKKRQQQIMTGTPVKPPQLNKQESSQKQQQASKSSDLKVKKRIMTERNDDDDFIVKYKKAKG
ncbi:uncharacterized protein LOC122087435 isoform X1 [Macadamia integrifolia]|uniref:uncharacterized protein LOC122087435 isoform X1 n=1 Tax=Macadamia integrifolia TaxID=60698 RepID=UPI001C4F1302|nr:uncharacterized protein LOC122087435 isoform X1 [Macadamia integrifolia]